uniref:Retrotransposon gag domain-containing protein n=1 Tax=Oryza glumipatula TaxID=40148 RepID=A0A0E0BR70_9ORYZ
MTPNAFVKSSCNKLLLNFKNMNKVMRKEFIPRDYELILLHHLKHVKQGSKSTQAYHGELCSFMCRANIIDEINAIEYLKTYLNPRIVAAIDEKYSPTDNRGGREEDVIDVGCGIAT